MKIETSWTKNQLSFYFRKFLEDHPTRISKILFRKGSFYVLEKFEICLHNKTWSGLNPFMWQSHHVLTLNLFNFSSWITQDATIIHKCVTIVRIFTLAWFEISIFDSSDSWKEFKLNWKTSTRLSVFTIKFTRKKYLRISKYKRIGIFTNICEKIGRWSEKFSSILGCLAAILNWLEFRDFSSF